MPQPRTLVLLRHGRTTWNAAKRIQGQLDPELDEAGLAQAAEVAPEIAKLEPTVLWASDLARARRTAAEVAAATGLAVRHDARLRETMLGERQGLTHEEYAAHAPEEFQRFLRGEWDEIPGAETSTEVADRIGAALGELAGELGPGETGVAVAHGAAIRIAIARLVGWDASRIGALRGMDNCGWAVLSEHPERGWTLAAYNRTA
ncbi:histidine phosphatase family protein [Nocardioides panacisoli]|uniref:histidine phosphatase family protein n=1 Tax=Nocardioides panacisoli TaxID=627624 RepID=UPI001C631385|nr:histidine phosphatase family protein [Nocardioides panacisoli]QYJ04627.1 histidine phosphatase family protein [Nocardioides panacisoli]